MGAELVWTHLARMRVDPVRLQHLCLLQEVQLRCFRCLTSGRKPRQRNKVSRFGLMALSRVASRASNALVSWLQRGTGATGAAGPSSARTESKRVYRSRWEETDHGGDACAYISSFLWISAMRRSSFSECLGKNWNLEL